MWLTNDKCSFENCPMNFLHFQVFVTITLFLPNPLITFASDWLQVKTVLVLGLLYIFILVFSFLKALRFSQILFIISARSILIVSPVSSSLSSFWMKNSKAACHHTLDSLPDRFWHSFLSSALALKELILILSFFFFCFTCSSSSLSDSDNGYKLAPASLDCSFPLALALEVHCFCYFTSQILKLRHKCIRKKLKAIMNVYLWIRLLLLPLIRACFLIHKVCRRKWL